jgi:hypothetical protein
MWAIPAFLLGTALGWITTTHLDNGIVWGVWFAVITWVFHSLYWLALMWKLASPPPVAAPILHPSDADVAPAFDPTWIEIQCIASPQDKHILHDLPIDFTDLFTYATGIMRDNKSTVYSEWVGSKAAGKMFSYQQDYETLIAWFVRWKYGKPNQRGSLELNEKGMDLLSDCLHQDFSYLSPTEVGDRASLHIPQYTKPLS